MQPGHTFKLGLELLQNQDRALGILAGEEEIWCDVSSSFGVVVSHRV